MRVARTRSVSGVMLLAFLDEKTLHGCEACSSGAGLVAGNRPEGKVFDLSALGADA